jgi:hypothetical protein
LQDSGFHWFTLYNFLPLVKWFWESYLFPAETLLGMTSN